MHNASPLIIGAIAIAATTSSSFAFTASAPGAPVTTPFDNAQVTITFVSSDAYYRGNLYFLGAGNPASLTKPTTDTDSRGLGQFLFDNSGKTTQSIILEGLFNAGDVLHFAYDVVAPSSINPYFFRTDLTPDKGQFAFTAATGRLAIEDLRPTNPAFDGDYNDLIVDIQFTAIPAPGLAALMAIGTLIPRTRRRRNTPEA